MGTRADFYIGVGDNARWKITCMNCGVDIDPLKTEPYHASEDHEGSVLCSEKCYHY
jgi:hypothetical protein